MSRTALLRRHHTILAAHHMRAAGRFLPARVRLHLGDIDYRPPPPPPDDTRWASPPADHWRPHCRRCRPRAAGSHGDAAGQDNDGAVDNAIFDACELSADWDGEFAHAGGDRCCSCDNDVNDGARTATIRELLEASPTRRLYAHDVRNSVAASCARLRLVVCCDVRGDALELLHPDIEVARRWYRESPTLRASCVEICVAVPDALRRQCLAARGPLTLEMRRVDSHRLWMDSVVVRADSQRPTYLALSVAAGATAATPRATVGATK